MLELILPRNGHTILGHLLLQGSQMGQLKMLIHTKINTQAFGEPDEKEETLRCFVELEEGKSLRLVVMHEVLDRASRELPTACVADHHHTPSYWPA